MISFQRLRPALSVLSILVLVVLLVLGSQRFPFQFGLDLSGGTQLSYHVDLSQVPEDRHEEILSGVQEVMERRVNGLGVAEPIIYTSSLGDSKAIVVELAGVSDVEEAKAIVGKTIQLEFKEENPNTEDPALKDSVLSRASSFYSSLQSGKSFSEAIKGESDYARENNWTVQDKSMSEWQSEDSLPENVKTLLSSNAKGAILAPQEVEGSYSVDATGNLVAEKGVAVFQIVDKKTENEEKVQEAEVKARHILLAYKDATRSEATRTKKEAKAEAERIKGELNAGADFAKLAEEFSDDAGSKKQGGDLGFFGKGKMTQAFEDSAFALEVNQVSDIIETEFGFHIIQTLEKKAETKETVAKNYYQYNQIFYSTSPALWSSEVKLNGAHFQHADVQINQSDYQPTVAITFTEEGKKIFAEMTEKNVGKRIAIFVGGNLISAPTVNEAIIGGQAIISGNFSLEEANNMARDLNTGAIPAPIELMGQTTISASLGALSLEQSTQAAGIGLLILAVFMVIYYRVPGLIAVIALSIYTLLMMFIIKSEWSVFLSLGLSLLVFGVINYLLLKSQDSGAEKFMAFIVSCFVLFFLTFTLSQAMTLTLAGIAGLVLSIGMAVDANILIFERSKEELGKGKPLQVALDQGFARAWDSIRDSNFSSLITCVILFYFGSSMIRGFALNLALGILVSMFSAITLTRTMLNMSAQSFLGKYKSLFSCGFGKLRFPFAFIKNTKVWLALSGLAMTGSIVAVLTLGIHFGMDFTGGSALEIRLAGAELAQVQGQIESGSVVQNEEGNFVIKTKNLSENELEALKGKLQTLSAEPLELIQYNSIGPSIGESMQAKAWMALALTLVMIVFYIAFAFRNVPKEISPWRFGFSAIAALVHDLVILLGIMSLASYYFGIEMDALFITALLTIMGFSIHDTIVVFDRLRENIAKESELSAFEEKTELALQQTFARSVNTSVSTLITILALWALGPESLRWFLASLSFGILVGTYSSIFVASPILLLWTRYAKSKN